MLFPKFVEGLEAVLFVALNSGADPVSSKQICSYQDVLPRHLEPVLQVLVKEGILKGTKGPKGGYTLARDKRKISIGEIFTFLSAENSMNAAESDCNCIRRNITRKINLDISNNIEKYLREITIEDLCKQAVDQIKTDGKPDFNI